MEYYINPIWFYLTDVSSSINFVSCICAVLFFGGAAILWAMDDEELDSITNSREETDAIILSAKSRSKKFIVTGIILFILAILCPSEKTCIRMMVAATVNKENVASVKEDIYDVIDYIDEKLDDDKE